MIEAPVGGPLSKRSLLIGPWWAPWRPDGRVGGSPRRHRAAGAGLHAAGRRDGRRSRTGARVLQTQAMKPWFRRFAEISQKTLDDDQALNRWMRSHLATAIHVCGTCKMGPSPADGDVVDQYGRVHRVTGLRVADTSIFPSPRAVAQPPPRSWSASGSPISSAPAPAAQPLPTPSPGDISHRVAGAHPYHRNSVEAGTAIRQQATTPGSATPASATRLRSGARECCVRSDSRS